MILCFYRCFPLYLYNLEQFFYTVCSMMLCWKQVPQVEREQLHRQGNLPKKFSQRKEVNSVKLQCSSSEVLTAVSDCNNSQKTPLTSLYFMQGINIFSPTPCIYTVFLLYYPIFNHHNYLINNITLSRHFLTKNGSKGIQTLKCKAHPQPLLFTL